MLRRGSRVRPALAAVALALTLAACGKKGPLRLPGDRPAEEAPALRARVREASVIVDFKVPEPRFFPERQQRWVLARVLRWTPPFNEGVEVGTIFDSGGFAYGAALSWTDAGRPPKSSLVYRVEFRDAERRRRALSPPLAISWDRVPDAPTALIAAGGDGVVSLSWATPRADVAGLRYRVYRRVASQPEPAPVSPEPVPDCRYTDSRTEPGREYCYSIRGVQELPGLEVEGPASPEACAATAAAVLPPRVPPGIDR